jgi:hypothetical protein
MENRRKIMANIRLTKEIEFTVEELENILVKYLEKEYNIVGESRFLFKIARKQIASQYPSDSYDRHEFDGVKIIVTTS